MPRLSLKERIKQSFFLLDGAMGTQLIARGTEAGVCNDYLNIESPEDFAAAAEKIHSAGVTIIGGCCGTGPGHIEAVAKRLK